MRRKLSELQRTVNKFATNDSAVPSTNQVIEF